MKSIKCSCGANAKPFMTDFEGFEVNGWKCEKCKEEYLDPRELNPILKLKKLEKENTLKAKVGVVGNSYTIRVPKPLIDAYHVRKGSFAKYKPTKEGFLVLFEQ